MAALIGAFTFGALPMPQANTSIGFIGPDHHNEAKKYNPCVAKKRA